jgi:hypothetical protein
LTKPEGISKKQFTLKLSTTLTSSKILANKTFFSVSTAVGKSSDFDKFYFTSTKSNSNFSSSGSGWVRAGTSNTQSTNIFPQQIYLRKQEKNLFFLLIFAYNLVFF